jgi:diguanylate cyclase (GGDEF)-like protein
MVDKHSHEVAPGEHARARDTIVIIEDDPATIRMLSAIVQSEGETLFAMDGEAGLKLVRQRRPTLVLLDVEMAGLDGYEVCRRIKADPDLVDVAIMFVTASQGMESEIRALEAGAVDFITKPLNPPVVLARVRTHMRLQRHSMAMSELALRDGLTGLFNRRHFLNVAENELARHRRQELPLTLAFIDIDFFKLYNDGNGHQAGDSCLIAVARALESIALRPGECMARFGGEEFVMIMPYSAEKEARAFGEKCCATVRALALAHAHRPGAGVVTVSVGLSSCVPQGATTVAGLLATADRALYQAKQGGRDGLVYLDGGAGAPASAGGAPPHDS